MRRACFDKTDGAGAAALPVRMSLRLAARVILC